MNLPKLNDLKLAGKKVILRADLDVVTEEKEGEFRLKALIPTLAQLSESKAKTIIIGHRGRPGGSKENNLSLKPVADKLAKLSGLDIEFVEEITGEAVTQKVDKLQSGSFICLENLRFNAGEETGDESFSKSLASLGEVYINEAFAASHRPHASITGLPKLLPHAPGFRFVEEVDKLSKLWEKPERPFIVVVGGAKKDKLDLIKPLSELADKVLVGGRLPDYMGDEGLVSVRTRSQEEKIIVGNLIMDKEDITLHTIERFEKELMPAKTVLLAGPMGKYEEEGHRQGTERVFTAVANLDANKITGGGDSHIVLAIYQLEDKFNWISVGGGAMLEFLAKRSLPGIDALLH